MRKKKKVRYIKKRKHIKFRSKQLVRSNNIDQKQ